MRRLIQLAVTEASPHAALARAAVAALPTLRPHLRVLPIPQQRPDSTGLWGMLDHQPDDVIDITDGDVLTSAALLSDMGRRARWGSRSPIVLVHPSRVAVLRLIQLSRLPLVILDADLLHVLPALLLSDPTIPIGHGRWEHPQSWIGAAVPLMRSTRLTPRLVVALARAQTRSEAALWAGMSDSMLDRVLAPYRHCLPKRPDHMHPYRRSPQEWFQALLHALADDG